MVSDNCNWFCIGNTVNEIMAIDHMETSFYSRRDVPPTPRGVLGRQHSIRMSIEPESWSLKLIPSCCRHTIIRTFE